MFRRERWRGAKSRDERDNIPDITGDRGKYWEAESAVEEKRKKWEEWKEEEKEGTKGEEIKRENKAWKGRKMGKEVKKEEVKLELNERERQ